MELQRITAAEADKLLSHHYLGPLGYPPRFVFTTPERNAVAVFSDPVAASFKVALTEPLELARLWRAPDAPFNTGAFLAASLRWLRKLSPQTDCVITYADPAQGHGGGVYRAANFQFIGPSRPTDYWETPDGRLSAAQVYRKLGTKSRPTIAQKRPDWKLIEGVPKLLFMYPMVASVTDAVEMVARRAKFSRAHGGFNVQTYQERFPPRTCEGCGQLFLAARSDARVCSHRCYMREYRKVRRPVTEPSPTLRIGRKSRG
jgi:hypothetical protein